MRAPAHLFSPLIKLIARRLLTTELQALTQRNRTLELTLSQEQSLTSALKQKVHTLSRELAVLEPSVSTGERTPLLKITIAMACAPWVLPWATPFTKTLWMPGASAVIAALCSLINLTAPVRDQLNGKLDLHSLSLLRTKTPPSQFLLALLAGLCYGMGVWGVSEWINVAGLSGNLALLTLPAILNAKRP
ncbi:MULTISPECIES: hypothetical protein [Deinococcus]|uniref:Uncharacterized protein n=1 Tax=Deinococcus rufus TaxID=2136097 RepID=A0ABV7Z652_9DEIO|nr:hypothetical protein [Deinococcus sp. AB2017081]WQE97189.1 hypothetical protein U2P90_19145 [Deinococcus sp. AB2017081]